MDIDLTTINDLKDISDLSNRLCDRKDELDLLIKQNINKNKNIKEFNLILDQLKLILQNYICDRILQIKEICPIETPDSKKLIIDFKKAYYYSEQNLNKQYIKIN